MSLIRHCLFAALALMASPVRAADGGGLFAPEALGISLDLRGIAIDGERSWTDGGFGKLRFGPERPVSRNALTVSPEPTEAALIWKPRISWTVSGTVVAVAQQGQEHPVDLSEAFVTWKPLSDGGVHIAARAGLMWPPVSLEHGGAEWWTAETITPSAINSWIGEEVKVIGAEATATTAIGNHRVSATAALFGFNDTAGTLLAFRGWALHDEKATAFGRQRLPPLDGFMTYAQAPFTSPVIELDNRPAITSSWRGRRPAHASKPRATIIAATPRQ